MRLKLFQSNMGLQRRIYVVIAAVYYLNQIYLQSLYYFHFVGEITLFNLLLVCSGNVSLRRVVKSGRTDAMAGSGICRAPV